MAALSMFALGLVYAYGVGRAWRTGGVGSVVTVGEALRFAIAWVALSAALLSPLESLAGRFLAGHMLQHLLLLVVAAPLLATAGVARSGLFALPKTARRRIGRGPVTWLGGQRRVLAHPLVALALYVAVLWLWHAPAAYQAALGGGMVHALEHGTMVLAGCLFWASVLPGVGGSHRRAGAVAALLAASFAGGGLGALMTLSPAPWYPAYEAVAAASGGDALRDQQLAGLLMWMPMGAVHAVAALLVAGRWLRSGESRTAPASSPVTTPRVGVGEVAA